MNEGTDALRMTAHPGDVRGGGEAGEEPGGKGLYLRASACVTEVHRAFSPGQLIGVVLKGAKNDHGAGAPGDPAKAQAVDQPVDGSRGAGAAKDHRMLGQPHRRAFDSSPLPENAGLTTREGAFEWVFA